MSEESDGSGYGGALSGAQRGGAAGGEEEGSLQPTSASGNAPPGGSDLKPFENREKEEDLIPSSFSTLVL
jgi:hypothetical protein